MKAHRQKKIMELIDKHEIETQDELVEALHSQGYDITQATISRDIKELGLVKVPGGIKAYRYSLPGEQRGGNYRLRLERLFRDSVLSSNDSENLIIVRTLPGAANAVASCLDHVDWPEIIGTVAGDDTILLIIKPKGAVVEIMERLNSLLA